MIQDTITKMRTRIEASESVRPERRAELLELLDTLEKEVSTLPSTHREQAQSLAGFADLSAHEATRATPNPQLLQLSLQGLSSSAAEFEKSHPRLVHIVNAISHTLSNLGI
jgi:hypothetical protein